MIVKFVIYIQNKIRNKKLQKICLRVLKPNSLIRLELLAKLISNGEKFQLSRHIESIIIHFIADIIDFLFGRLNSLYNSRNKKIKVLVNEKKKKKIL